MRDAEADWYMSTVKAVLVLTYNIRPEGVAPAGLSLLGNSETRDVIVSIPQRTYMDDQ